MSLRSESPHGHVVVGTDGSRAATNALDQASGEAHRRQVPLEIVHAWPWGGAYDPLDDDAQDILAKAAQHVTDRSPELQVTTIAVPDDAAEVLVRRSQTAALTVVGTRGNGGFKGLLLGSVSLRVAAHCRSPLLVVRDDLATQPISSPPTVVVGIRGEEDDPAAAFALAEAIRRNANLSIVHAWTYNRNDRTHDDRASRARHEDATVARIATALHQKDPFIQLDSRSVRGAPSQTLIEASATSTIVVLAAHRRKSGLGLQLGPVIQTLLHHARCHVALVPVMPGTQVST